MQKKVIISITIWLVSVSTLMAQKTIQDSLFNTRRCFIGSSLFVLSNVIQNQKNQPDFMQLNFGYWLTPKDVISVEFKTWKYAWSLGIPYGKSFESLEEKFPGYVRSVGFAIAYQRFLWKSLYVAVHAMNAKQTYYDENKNKIQNGYQLFLTYRLGYHIAFLKNRFFIEPSMAVTHRPIDTNMPESFAKLNEKWSSFFPFEPGLHFGMKF